MTKIKRSLLVLLAIFSLSLPIQAAAASDSHTDQVDLELVETSNSSEEDGLIGLIKEPNSNGGGGGKVFPATGEQQSFWFSFIGTLLFALGIWLFRKRKEADI